MMGHEGRCFKESLVFSLLIVCSLVLSGYAESGQFYEKNGVAIDGFDPVAYFEEHEAIKGLASLSSVYKGSTFLFASRAHLTAFVQAPERFAPQFGGFCAYGIAEGVKAKSEGDVWEIVAGKLYLNYDQQIQAKWKSGKEGFIRQAEAKWLDVESSTAVYK